ncbi:hypothetical protein GCM10010123_32630 [Pilimelia anulata]|uniref:Aminoglycoside phosphotransferase n=1 Tax=Pilimelia anulata TaxID=53371 RepID=A0A8J3B7M2_9ACTN|nr:phosphotransferase [Pilimelia anulata]GGK00196.1 hypothetical protein GCM10010123_32630 [Pilimelia anulata]
MVSTPIDRSGVGLGALLGVPDADAPAALAELVGAALGVAPDPAATVVEDVPHEMGSPATGGVHRIRGVDAAGRPWSLFCKVLQHARHWPLLVHLPPAAAEWFVADFPWRSELELWDPVVQGSLPTGLRSPVLHRVVDLGDDRVAVWQEDIPVVPAEWDPDRYADAAELLGRWNARSTAAGVLAVNAYPPCHALRVYAEQAVAQRGLGPLADDALWSHPRLAAHGDLRARLRRLGGHIPALLDRLTALPQCLPHGDASPQNLLVAAADGPARFVAIDLSFRTPHPLGFDLGQLLVGLTHAGIQPAALLPAIADTILPAYRRGLAAEGLDDAADAAAEGFALATLVRSGFDGFRYDLIDSADPAEQRVFDERVAMSRALADRAEPWVTG